ncbi:cyclophilin type peptidyl-prolyl cis-trans isomerase/CLD [Thozetella sp. PMI_491]|nr:cyclophilin type peptidyl-prolyl cis-trans isomerase/CLD [Thozetella sp. PMI_491]
MSTIYNLEPQPTASAIIHTTQGEIEVELFAKQTPLTCRNFLQLSLDGYYDNTVFHRLVPGFILQGGDPTGTGNGGESIYDGGALSDDLDPWPMDQRRGKNAGPQGVNFKDEFHSRLKFNRRGLLGMANESTPDTNSSQFFFTLGKAEELTNKNTLFGRVAGDTIYNLAKMGEAEVEDGGERPLYPVKITHVEILNNPFEGMTRREKVARKIAPAAPAADKKRKKPKAGKQLLSFGDEEGDMGDIPVRKKAKFDSRIVVDLEEEKPVAKEKLAKGSTSEKAKAIKKESKTAKPAEEAPKVSSPPPPQRQKKTDKGRRNPPSDEESISEPEEPAKKSALEQTNAEIAALKASMRRTAHTEPVKEEKKSALEQLIPENATRGRKLKPGRGITAKEEQKSLDFLRAFKSKLEQAPAEKDNAAAASDKTDSGKGKDIEDEADVCDLHFIANCQSCQAWDKKEGEESDDEGWMSHMLSFAADKLGKDLSYRKKAEEELVVIDPLEKARTLKEEKKASRDARTKGSGRAWDQGRQ